jgi:general secretion pathway protein G
LQALREQPDGVAKWDGPYLKKAVPTDPWGNAFAYESPSEHGDYAIISYGADGRPGGEDEDTDIVSWQDIAQ